MRRVVVMSAMVVLSVVSCGVVACTSVGVSPAGAAIQANKAAFCGANDAIDRASANVNSQAGFLAVLKSHSHDLAIMKKDAPPGSLGQTVQAMMSAADAAVSSNNPNDLNNVPGGASIDTYCGVDGDGNPLPTYFGKGRTTAFCSTFLPIFQAVSNADNSAGILAALTAHQTQISQLTSELSSLPKSIKAKATTTVDKAQTAVTDKNVAAIQGNGSGAAMYVALYCGQNQ
jgi:hypothetical protein